MQFTNFSKKSMDFIETPVIQDARINILEGSVRSSKTVTMIPKWLEYINSGPPGLLAMTGVSKQTIKTNVLNDLFDTVGRSNYRYNKQSGELNIYGRDILVIGIKDEGSEKYLRGPTFSGAYCDEMTTMPENSFKQLLNRLSIENSKLYGTTNPDSPYHYLYTDFMKNKELLRAGTVKSYHYELDDNLSLSEEYKKYIRSAYSGLWYKRMIQGLWVQAEGAIYDMFDDKRNTCSKEQLPQAYDRIINGIDFGAGNPTAFGHIGITDLCTGDPMFWQFSEYHHDPRNTASKTTAQYKADLIDYDKQLSNAHYIDPSALAFIIELESVSLGYQFDNIWKADNAVLPGINTVAQKLSRGKHIVCRDTCPETLKEYMSYVWDANAQKKGEDKPLKTHDHHMDRTRYALHTEFPAVNKGRLIA